MNILMRNLLHREKHAAKQSTGGSALNQATVGAGTASGTGSTMVNSNHILQYPRQPRPDDGKWIAIGSMIGALLGLFASKGTIEKAKAAEDKWRYINDQLFEKGKEMWDLMPQEKSKADAADGEIDNLYHHELDLRNEEENRMRGLDSCNDMAFAKLCEYVQCGYQPDYGGILKRAQADAAVQTQIKRRELCKNLNRYNTKACCGIETQLAMQSVNSVVGAVSQLREKERAQQYQINEGLYAKAAEMFDRARNLRFGNARDIDKTAIALQQDKYKRHNQNYYDLARFGGDLLSSAGKNFAYLAESYRKTAEKDNGGLATLFGIIAALLPAVIDMTSPDDSGCGGS